MTCFDIIKSKGTGLFVLLLLVFSFFSCSQQADRTTKIPERIISFAPSITEILFELGLGNKVVGVTRYCDYPDEVKTLPKIGGFMDPNYEAIVALKPDMVILLASHKDAIVKLGKFNIATLPLKHETIDDIHQSINRTASACGVPESASRLLNNIDRRSAIIKKAVRNRKRPRVMICIGRDTRSANMSGLYIAGRNNFYDEVIAICGGVNAYSDTIIPYPQLSAEGIISLNPDVIIDLADHNNSDTRNRSRVIKQWSGLPSVEAVKNRRIYFIKGTYALHPGPRYIQLIEELAPLLHPDAFTGRAHD